jgi:hypothetical protein
MGGQRCGLLLGTRSSLLIFVAAALDLSLTILHSSHMRSVSAVPEIFIIIILPKDTWMMRALTVLLSVRCK